ncbi:hypothetical protein FJT64_027639 [Amphibalanus amphitrite]|uniref:Chitin-binding type-4 domain-containing protein n=1 Tax=Amphibalanus amphitrite TaxID=1232801 RepID=A0A6A4VUG4_AMPAM|nr:hypothetical protein FJT64_027639 [Amphibalanus amphitrite]
MRSTLGVLLLLVGHVAGHGRLMDPPARNAMWRFNFSNPVNYNDNELFCGGFVVHHQQNGGKCGPCGDNYVMKVPRPHEAGGEFAQGIIGKRYTSGQLVEVEVELTANHRGKFVIRLCPHNNDKTIVTQECFNRYPLMVAGTHSHEYSLQDGSGKAGIFRWKVELPPYLTCTQCVMQWTYYAGNTWGTCSDGEQAVGCGPQETFINCADIAIVSNTPYFGPVHNSSKCEAVGKLAEKPEAHLYCHQNCLGYPSHCPQDKCRCF